MSIDKKNISPVGILKLCEKFVLFYHVWLQTRHWWPNCKLKACVSLPHKHRKQLANLYNIQLNLSLAKGPCHETANITNTFFYDFSVYQPPETAETYKTNLPNQSNPKYYAQRRWFCSKTCWKKPISLPKCLVRPASSDFWKAPLVASTNPSNLPFNWQTWTTPKSHSALKYLPLYENLMLFCKDGLGDSNIPTQEIGKISPAAILKKLLWVVWVRAVDLWVGVKVVKGGGGRWGQEREAGEGWVSNTWVYLINDLAETITWNTAFMYSEP